MIELGHFLPEPQELVNYRGANPNSAWGDEAFNPVREILRHQLNLEQDGLCIYCERELDQDLGHVEHIKPRNSFHALRFTYDNLAHSCNGPNHCGPKKDRKVLPIEPRPDCNRFFSLSFLDGRIIPSLGLNANETQDAQETVDILGLDEPGLARQRKGYADTIRALSAQEAQAFLATAPFRWILSGI